MYHLMEISYMEEYQPPMVLRADMFFIGITSGNTESNLQSRMIW